MRGAERGMCMSVGTQWRGVIAGAVAKHAVGR